MSSTQPTPADWEALRAAEKRLLALNPVTITAQDLTIEGEPIHYLETGNPHLPPLVMLHGRGGSAAMFSSIFALLAPHRHVYAIDMRGWGLSTRAPYTGATPAQAVAWWRDGVLATIDALGLHRYDLLGHSLGGMIAMEVALARPTDIDHLILEDTAGFPGSLGIVTRAYFAATPERLASWAPPSVFNRVLETSVMTKDLTPGARDAVRAYVRQLTLFPGTLVSGARAFNMILDLRGSHYDISQRMGELQPMTRVIWGAKDVVIPLSIVQAGVRLIPHGDLVVIPNVGHSPHLEAPEAFARNVLAFLARGPEVSLAPQMD